MQDERSAALFIVAKKISWSILLSSINRVALYFRFVEVFVCSQDQII